MVWADLEGGTGEHRRVRPVGDKPPPAPVRLPGSQIVPRRNGTDLGFRNKLPSAKSISIRGILSEVALSSHQSHPESGGIAGRNSQVPKQTCDSKSSDSALSLFAPWRADLKRLKPELPA